MAGDGDQHFAIVANYQTACMVADCPWCYLDLPHNATPDMVERRCYEITGLTRIQIQTAAITYARKINSLRQIMSTFGLPSRLHVVRTTGQMFDAAFAAEYETYMRPHANYHPVPGRSVASSSGATADWWNGAAAPSDSGDVGTTRPESRFMGDDEFPRWEFRGGKEKKLKWQAYYREPCELLEAAFELGIGQVVLTIDDWKYEVDLVNMTQRSLTTEAIRTVRRLTGPPAM
jgi:hypothetical protein